MGAAARGADRVILTSDNPRNEQPEAIMAQIAEGLGDHPQVVREVERARAIELAIRSAAPEDVVLIAGKGHELEQESAGVRTAFSDVAIVRQVQI